MGLSWNSTILAELKQFCKQSRHKYPQVKDSLSFYKRLMLIVANNDGRTRYKVKGSDTVKLSYFRSSYKIQINHNLNLISEIKENVYKVFSLLID